MTYQDIKNNDEINTYIRQADQSLSALGYTEHSFAHVTLVAEKAGYILSTLGYPDRTVELVMIAGYLHDIGNIVNRVEHSQSGAIIAFRILDHLGFPPDEIGQIVTAIGVQTSPFPGTSPCGNPFASRCSPASAESAARIFSISFFSCSASSRSWLLRLTMTSVHAEV